MFEWVKRKCTGDDPNMEKSNAQATMLMDQSKEPPPSHYIHIKPVQVCVLNEMLLLAHHHVLYYDLTADLFLENE